MRGGATNIGSATYNFVGGWQVFNVPTGVKLIHATVYGAGSTTSRGGRVIGNLSVKDTDKLYLVVGGAGRANSGHNGGNGGWGAGGDGADGYNANGGDGGGGYSAIRLNSTAGSIRCVAGGGAGDSGDGGDGGSGGTTVGESGSRGNAGSGATGAATGGTQTQGGNAGTSSSGGSFIGRAASDVALGSAGNGGSTGGYNGPGGGGGGGGWRSGGGGQGGSTGWAPGGGGGGGSNYIGGLSSASTSRGVRVGNGLIVLTWSDPAPANSRPNNPSLSAPSSGLRTKATSVTFKATLSDPNKNNVRMRIVISQRSDFKSTYRVVYSPYVASGKVASLTVGGLAVGWRYFARVYTQDSKGVYSLGYASTNFYSNFPPTAPTLNAPTAGAQLDGLSTINFTWTHHDPDGSAASGSRWSVRNEVSTDWIDRDIPGGTSLHTVAPGTFKSNNFYLWRVRTRDPAGLWGPYSQTRRFYLSGVSTPPSLGYPRKGEAIHSDRAETFTWRFRDPDRGDTQARADIRYKKVNQDDSFWVTKFGNVTTPGATPEWTFPAQTFGDGGVDEWEWQVRTYDTLGGGIVPSEWSDSAMFYVAASPGILSGEPIIPSNAWDSELGCGHNEAWLTVRGGAVLLGKLEPATAVTWGRVRDDISSATVRVDLSKCNSTAVQLMSIARSWQHELTVYRDNGAGKKERVWEGPITRITYATDYVEFEAKDVMQWVYRRILKQGYSDAYPHTRSAVERAERIIVNALARGDYHILPYLTTFNFEDDAKQTRTRPDYSTTSWEEVDDLAAKGGIDYTTVGRRIIIWDTHRPIGRLPAMHSGQFSEDPIVTEYGMNLATEYAVTNGAGLYGTKKFSKTAYGSVEMLVSAYGDVAAAADATLTAAGRAKLVSALTDQAVRGSADRFPSPLVVRVPDNSALRPDIPVPINYWIPGVWIPLRATHVCREFSQWQKLDSVQVTEDPQNGEVVTVVMSPAPNEGIDPDADEAAVNDGG